MQFVLESLGRIGKTLNGDTKRGHIQPTLCAFLNGCPVLGVLLLDPCEGERVLPPLLLQGRQDSPNIAYRNKNLGIRPNGKEHIKMPYPRTALVGHDGTIRQAIEGILAPSLDVVIEQRLPALWVRDCLELFCG